MKSNIIPTEKLYVGKLNIGHKIGNLLTREKPTKHDLEQIKLKSNTLANGAISLNNISFTDIANWDERIRYESIFTLFYELDKNTYICLHNGNTYNLKGENYCSDLTPLISCIPKISYKIDDRITCTKARSIFNVLFKDNNKDIYNNRDKYNLDSFYHANLELCIGNDKEDANLAQVIMLSKNGIYPISGYTKKDNELFRLYNVIILMLENNKLLNINDNRINESNIKLTSPLKVDRLYSDNIKEDKVTIPKILKIQRINNKD